MMPEAGHVGEGRSPGTRSLLRSSLEWASDSFPLLERATAELSLSSPISLLPGGWGPF
jgi:hypothetical protein